MKQPLINPKTLRTPKERNFSPLSHKIGLFVPSDYLSKDRKGLWLGLFLSFCLLLISQAGFAQLRGINYQAVAIDENGKEVVGMDLSGQSIQNKTIAVRFSILSGSSSGTVLYQETHTTGTDRYGLFSLIIGDGTVSNTGQYQLMIDIPWSTANQFLKVEIDIKNDGNFKLMSIQQFMSVPYAFYSLKSGTAGNASNWELTGNDSTTAGTNFIGTTDSVDFVVKTNNIEKLRLTAAGNLGFGTSTPNGNGLQIGGANIFGKILDIQAPDLNAVRMLQTDGLAINNGMFQEYNFPTSRAYASYGTVSNHDMAIKTNNVERITITDSGNVGIGTIAPTEKLQVAGRTTLSRDAQSECCSTGDFTLALSENTQVTGKVPTLQFHTGGYYEGYMRLVGLEGGPRRFIFGDHQGSGMGLQMSGPLFVDDTIKSYIKGNLGIGTTSPSSLLNLYKDGATLTIQSASTDPATRTSLLFKENTVNHISLSYDGSAGSPNNKLNIRNEQVGLDMVTFLQSGNVGIGTTAPGAMLEVAGQVKITGGNPALGAVLTSDAAGLASWASPTNGTVTNVTGVLPISVTTGSTTPVISVANNTVVSDGTVKSGSGQVNMVWKTDASGAPDWRTDSSSVYIAGTGLTLSGSTFNSVWTSSGTDIYSNSTGNIGIGTTSPAQLLHLSSASTTGTQLRIDNNDTGGRNWTIGSSGSGNIMGPGKFVIADITQISSRLTIDLTGNVGIGTTNPDISALLDVSSNNKGVLIPRVALTGTGDITTIASAAASLLIYNIATAGVSPNNVVPGYYYWNGTKWVSLSGGTGSNDWGLLGNAGTVDGTNFIGTTDNIPFNIRVNNENAGKIDPLLHNTFLGYKSGNAGTSGTFNTANGDSALYSNTTGNSNTASGGGALYSNTTGINNTADGFQSLYYNTTGTRNTATGMWALWANTTGFRNTAHGYQALVYNTTGGYNTASGMQALYCNTSGSQNTSIGMNSLFSNTTGDYNTASGMQALYTNTTGTQNTAYGAYSLFFNTTGNYNAASGSNALYNNTTGSFNTAAGNGSLYANTTGGQNTAYGSSSLGSNTIGQYNTAVGEQTLYKNTTGNLNTAIGTQALYENTTGIQNTATGVSSLRFNTTGNFNTATGLQSLYTNTSGVKNTATGAYSLYLNTTGDNNTASGYWALYSNTTGDDNVANGLDALRFNTTGYNNTANGKGALRSNTTGFSNTANGMTALYSNTIGKNNTADGYQALYSNVAGSNATAVGVNAMQYANSTSTAYDNFNVAVGFEALRGSAIAATNIGNYNTAVGYQSLQLNSAGSYNTANGTLALSTNSTGSYNTAIGAGALNFNTQGIYNTASGYASLNANTIGSFNTATGTATLNANTIGEYNTATGAGALFLNIDGLQNTATGAGALYSNTSGRYNTASGNGALYYNTTANANSAYGDEALESNTTGYSNTSIGRYSLHNNTTGYENTAIGTNALENNVTGINNTALGFNAFNSGAAFNNSTALGYDAQITADNTIQLGNASVTDVKTSGTVSANGYTTAFSSKSSTYTLTAADDIVSVTGTTTITLPSAVGIAGRKYTVKNIDAAATVTVSASGTEMIDGTATKPLALQYQYLTILSDGANWLIVANN